MHEESLTNLRRELADLIKQTELHRHSLARIAVRIKVLKSQINRNTSPGRKKARGLDRRLEFKVRL